MKVYWEAFKGEKYEGTLLKRQITNAKNKKSELRGEKKVTGKRLQD